MTDQPRGITVLFFRREKGKEMFYPIQFMGGKPPEEEAAEHAALNPGTLRVETISGEVLWQAERNN